MKKIAFICLAAIVMALPAAVMAQQRPGQIKGRVVDMAGNPVSNLTLVVRNTVTGIEHQAKTEMTGEFLFASLEPGKYTVHNSATGANPKPQEARVDPESTTHLNMKEDGAGHVEIAAETIVTDMSTAPIRTVFSPTQVEFLPQPNAIAVTGEYYSAYNLSLLSEGVTPGSVLQWGVGPAVGGRPNTSNSFLVEGTDNNNRATPGPLVTVSNEALTEFALMQGQHSPVYTHVAGGNLNLSLASADNGWHGGVYDYLNNRNLNAHEPSVNVHALEDRRYDQNRMGGKVGGPFVKNLLFGFVNFEYVPLRLGRLAVSQVLAPTPLGFNLLALTPGISGTNLGVLRNNLRVSDTTVGFATINGTSIPLGVVDTTYTTKKDRYEGIARLDWIISGTSNLAAKYIHNDIGTDAFGNSLVEAFKVPGHTRSLLGVLTYTKVFSNSTTATINGGYNRLDQGSHSPNPVFPGQTAFPNINIQGLGLSLGSNVPVGRADSNTYQGSGAVDFVMDQHRLTFGADWRDSNSSIGDFSRDSGNFTFSTLDRFLRDLPPDVVAQRSFGNTDFNGNQNLVYLFGKDNIRVGQVDVELGLGYQYAQVQKSLRRQSEFADFSISDLIEFNEPESDNMNFAPRLGLAWSHSKSQTVFRGSFGMMYDAMNGNGGISNLVSPGMRVGTVTSSLLNTPGFFAFGGITEPTTVASGISTFIPDQKLPYIVNWSLAASHGFWGKLATEFKYMGHHGVHQPLYTILNDNRVNPLRSLPVFFTAPSQATLNALTVTQQALASADDNFLAAGFTNPILTVRPDGTSWYNAATVKLAETFSGGTQLTGQYTWSDVTTDATGTPLDNVFGRRKEQAPWNVKHRATVTAFIDVASMLPQDNGFIHNIVANLSIAGTYQYGSSARVPLFTGLDSGMNGNGFGSGVFVNPLGIAGTGTGVTPLTNSFGQTVAFQAIDPNAQFVSGAVGTFSDARPTLELDDTSNIDMAIIKRFEAPHHFKVEFRADAFNLFNHAQFTGTPISTLGANANFILPSNPQFNNIRGSLSGNPRTVQLALRLIF